MIFKTFAELNRALKAKKEKLKVTQLNHQNQLLSEVSELLGNDILHIFEPDFDENPQKYLNNDNYQFLRLWRYLHAYCYQDIDGTQNPCAEEEWGFLLNLTKNQPVKWVDAFVNDIISGDKIEKNDDKNNDDVANRAHQSLKPLDAFKLEEKDGIVYRVYSETEKKYVPIKLKVNFKKTQTIFFLSQHFSLTAQDLTDANGEFNKDFFKNVKPLIEKLAEFGEPFGEFLLKLGKEKLLDFKALQTLDFENPRFKEAQAILATNDELWPFLKPLFIAKNSALPPHLRPFDKTYPSDETQEIPLTHLLGFIVFLEEQKQLTLALSLMKKGLLDFSILFQQAKYLEENQDNFEENFNQWLIDYDRQYNIINPDENAQKKIQSLKNMVAYGLPIAAQKKAMDKNFFATRAKENRINSTPVDLSTNEATLDPTLLLQSFQNAFSYNEKGELIFIIRQHDLEVNLAFNNAFEYWLEYLEKIQADEITEINLFYMPLSEENFQKFLTILPKLTKLKTLDFGKNQIISESTKDKLREILPKCDSLNELCYRHSDENIQKETQNFLEDCALPPLDENQLIALAPIKELQETVNKKLTENPTKYLRKIRYTSNQSVYDDYIKCLRHFNKSGRQILDLHKVRTSEPVVFEALFNELTPDTKKGIRSLIVDFTSFSDANFKRFMKNFVHNFSNLNCIEFDLDFDETSLTEEEFQSRQNQIIEAISFLPRLHQVIFHDVSYELSPFFYEKLNDLALKDDNAPNPKHLIIDLPLFEPFYLEDSYSEIYRVQKESEIEKIQSRHENRRQKTKYENISALVKRRQKQRDEEKERFNKIIPEIQSLIKPKRLSLEDSNLDEMIELTPIKTVASLKKENKTNVWLTDASFSDETDQRILNGLLAILGNTQETAEERLDFYHRFGLLPALMAYIEEGFRQKTLTWADVAKLDTLKKVKPLETVYAVPLEKNTPENHRPSALRDLPRLLARHTKNLSVDKRIEFDLYDANPALHRQEQHTKDIFEKHYEKFLDTFFNDVLKPVTKKRIELCDEFFDLETKKNQTTDLKEKKALVKEMHQLSDKIKLLSGFIQKYQSDLKTHQEAIVNGFEDCNRGNFSKKFPLFDKAYFEKEDKMTLSDDTYLKAMQGDITLADLNSPKSKKPVSDSSRQYAKDFCRKLLTAFVMTVTFPVSIPAVLIASKCYGLNPYGTLFKTKTGACLDGAEKKAKKLSEEMTKNLYIQALHRNSI